MHTLLAMILVTAAAGAPLIPPCPSSPNCVSSQAADSHSIAPLAISADAENDFTRLRKILEQRDDTSIIEADDKLIRVEFKTTLGFVDDGLFVLDADKKAIQIRSAARKGYWDFGKNRRRLEEIRSRFNRADNP